MNLKSLFAGATLAMVSGAALADCAFENQNPVKVLATGFDAWKAVTEAIAECGNVAVELSQEAHLKQVPGFAAKPPLFQLAGVHNSGLVPLVDQNLVRPLDDLIAKHGQAISPNQMIRVDGRVVAVAMMVNAQHLMYRADILSDLGIEVPSTYEEVLAAAEKIEQAGVVQYPLGYEPGENARGATETARKDAVPYPASTQMGLMQIAVANNIADFLTGRTDAQRTLASIESAYLVSAREAGLLE